MAVLIVGSPLLRVAQHFIRFFGFLEFFFRSLGCVTLVTVGVVLHRQFAIRLFDLVFAGVLGNAQYFVKVSFRHVCVPYSMERKRRAGSHDATLNAAVCERGWCRGAAHHQPQASTLFDLFHFGIHHVVSTRTVA